MRREMTALICLGFPIFYVFWIVFSGTFAVHELMIGAVGALLATSGMLVIGVQYPALFSPSACNLIAIWRIPWYVLSGTWEIAVVAAKDLLGIKSARSLFRVASFHAGENKDPRATARRVLAVAYTTIAPNFIVLGINTSDRRMLFHQIERSTVPKMSQGLGAEQ